MSELRQYLVTLKIRRKIVELEVPSMLGPDAAGRRAWLTAVHARWGDLDEVKIASVEDITAEYAARLADASK